LERARETAGPAVLDHHRVHQNVGEREAEGHEREEPGARHEGEAHGADDRQRDAERLDRPPGDQRARGEEEPSERRESGGHQEIALPPAAEEGHEVREQAVGWLDEPGDGADEEEIGDLARREPPLLEHNGDRLVRQVPHPLREVDDAEQDGQTLGVGSLEGVQPHEPAEHRGRHDTFKRGMLSVCPHDCPSACSLVLTVEDGRLTGVTGNPDLPFTQGVICGKVREYAERVHSPLRVLTPLRRVGAKGRGEFEPIAWDEAINVMTLVKQARARGAFVVVVDPYRTSTAQQADLHLMVRPGTDAALALAVMHVLIDEGHLDRDYIERATLGIERLAEHVKAYSPEAVAPIVGLDAATIVRFARRYGVGPRTFIRIGIGISRNDNGGMTCRTLACLPALTGAYA